MKNATDFSALIADIERRNGAFEYGGRRYILVESADYHYCRDNNYPGDDLFSAVAVCPEEGDEAAREDGERPGVYRCFLAVWDRIADAPEDDPMDLSAVADWETPPNLTK